jgi:hypothetical protein
MVEGCGWITLEWLMALNVGSGQSDSARGRERNRELAGCGSVKMAQAIHKSQIPDPSKFFEFE